MDRDTMRKRVLARLPQQQRGSWYEIKALDEGKAVIRIYDEISWFGVTADDFARELAAVSASELEVQINSPGGDAFDGVAIYNALRAHPARVTTRVDGVAASAASIIAQAGDHRVMMTSAQIMIHEAWGIVIGPASEMRGFADQLDKLNDIMARLYATRAGGDAEHFRELMATETWLADTEAVEAGLADEVFEPPRQDAPADGKPDSRPDSKSDLADAVRAELGRLGVDLAALPATNPPDPAPVPAGPDLSQDAVSNVFAAFDLQERGDDR